jgi:hypothetical protein
MLQFVNLMQTKSSTYFLFEFTKIKDPNKPCIQILKNRSDACISIVAVAAAHGTYRNT